MEHVALANLATALWVIHYNHYAGDSLHEVILYKVTPKQGHPVSVSVPLPCVFPLTLFTFCGCHKERDQRDFHDAPGKTWQRGKKQKLPQLWQYFSFT